MGPHYWIYVSLSEPIARVHESSCRDVRDRPTTLSPDSWWASAFGSREEAHAAARRMLEVKGPLIEDCTHCSE